MICEFADLLYNYSIYKKGVIEYEQIGDSKPTSICYCKRTVFKTIIKHWKN